MRALPWANVVLGVALVAAACLLILNGQDGAARTVLYAASAAAFGSAATSFRRR